MALAPSDQPTDKVILLVEDDEAAFFFLQIAFEELGEPLRLFRVCSGEEAVAFLSRDSQFHEAPRPSLILLNLHMPRMNGFELLAHIKRDPNWRDIPSVVFTSSKLDSDRAKCMALGATDFISKPYRYDDVMAAIKTACAYAT